MPTIIIALPDQLGGIAALNHNLVEYSSFRERVKLKIILYRDTTWTTPLFGEPFTWGETVRFEFSRLENRYAVLKRFSQLIGDGEGALVCNDNLELEAESIYPTGKRIYSIIHDFYNLKLAIQHYNSIDVFIAHSKLFHQVMMSSNPVANNFYYLPHGVFIPEWKEKTAEGKLGIAFIGRLVEAKGVMKLYEINELLKKKKTGTEWTIIGGGELKELLQQQWKNETNVIFCSPATKKNLLEIIQKCHLFVLPTAFEGSPVSILEAMSCGLVPLVSDLPGGIQEVVTSDLGFKLDGDDPLQFADCIEQLNDNRELLNKMSLSAYSVVKEKYNINATADKYFSLFNGYRSLPGKSRQAKISIGSMLDKKFIPNWVVKMVRRSLHSQKPMLSK